MNAHELNQRLCDQIEVVLKHLFPNGRKVRSEFVVGGLTGEAGDSLKIHIGGSKKGFWSDFATGHKSRTLLGLWAEVLSGDYARACKEARAYLGIADDYGKRFFREVKAAEPGKLDRSKMRALVPDGPAVKYLTDERCLELGVVTLYKVCESSSGDAVVFPFFAVEGQGVDARLAEQAYMTKFMKLARVDGKKEIWTQPAGVTDSLFGKRADLPKTYPAGTLVICEGEIDALSVACYGWHGVSVPRGAKATGSDGKSANDQWIDADYEWLANFERIYLWMDADDPGQKAAADIARRIGLERCFVVKTPRGLKDANECLCAGVTVAELQEAFEGAQTLDPANLQWASVFVDAVLRRLFPPGGVEPGFDLPWPLPWKIRPGEMTVWTGFSGHGKTVLLSQLAVHLANEGQRVCVASMEVEPDRTLETLWCQANGARMPWEWEEIQKLLEQERIDLGTRRFHERYPWLADRFLVFLPEVTSAGVGRADWRTMMECFIYARQRYGCEQFVVDSLMMCVGRSEGEYQEVELFVNALASFAKRHQVHLHLVAHSRKREDEAKPPGKQDIAGPKETADIAHNVAVVHRNHKKSQKWQLIERNLIDLRALKCSTPAQEADRAEKLAEGEKELAVVKAWHDGELHLLKQRNGDGEVASKYLFFHANARQFVQDSPWGQTRTAASRPRRYIPLPESLPTTEELRQ